MPHLKRVLVKKVQGVRSARRLVKKLEGQGLRSAAFSNVTVSGRRLSGGRLEVYALARKKRVKGFQVKRAAFI
jgi:hypothetical protein